MNKLFPPKVKVSKTYSTGEILAAKPVDYIKKIWALGVMAKQ